MASFQPRYKQNNLPYYLLILLLHHTKTKIQITLGRNITACKNFDLQCNKAAFG